MANTYMHMQVCTCISIKFTVTVKHQSPVSTNQGTAAFTGDTITTTSNTAAATITSTSTTTTTVSKPSIAVGVKSSTVGGDKGLFNN